MENVNLTSVSGKPLRVYVWPVENPKGAVQLVHGMAEHMGRYDRLARALNDAGYAVTGHDHLGHGPSAQKGELGYFGPENGWDHVIRDIRQVTDYMKQRFPDVPCALLGHSMGSFAVREYLIRWGNGLDACVISGTGWHPAALASSARAMAAVCGAASWTKPANAVNKMGFGSYNKSFEPARTPFDWLTRDEKEVDKYIADPLCGFTFTARAYYDMFGGLKALSDLKRLAGMPKDLPVYFVSGSMDPVGGSGTGVNTVAGQFRNAGMKDVTVRLYEGGRHEMFNEINRDQVTADLIAWLDSRLEKKQSA